MTEGRAPVRPPRRNDGHGQDGVKRLDFLLPEFTRLSWVSDEAREVWGPRLQRITGAWVELEWLSVAAGLRSCGIVSEAPGGVRPGREPWTVRGLESLLLGSQASPDRSEGEGGGDGAESDAAGDPPVVVVGTVEDLRRFRVAYERADPAEASSLLGMPVCCHDFYRRVWVEDGWIDPTWPMAVAGLESPEGYRIRTLDGPPAGNPLWRWMGARAVPHLPCDANCCATEELGNRFMDLGRESGFEQEMDWLIEVLSWPVEWSALHGIAEIKTPILKVITRTDATAERLVVRRSGSRYPDEGAEGLGFPFRAERPPRVALSAAFRRGLEHPISEPAPRRPWLATDNGFETVAAMERAHRPVVELVGASLGVRPGAVLDLGCGNGALLRTLQQQNPRLEVFGVDISPERIRHAQELMPQSSGNFRCGDMFEVDLPRPLGRPLNLILLMPGRLVEAGPERAERLARRILSAGGDLLVYAYPDWLSRFGGLDALVRAAPGLQAEETLGDTTAGYATIELGDDDD